MSDRFFYALSMLLFLMSACDQQKQKQIKETVVTLKENVPQVKLLATSDQLAGLWFSTPPSGTEYMQLDSNGLLHFPNIYSMTGRNWVLSADTLFLTGISGKYDEPFRDAFHVELKGDSLVLNSFLPDSFTQTYIRFKPRTDADLLTGRWTGVEGAFIDIIPDSGLYLITRKLLNGKIENQSARAQGDRIYFIADTNRYLYRTNGRGTGMKYLLNKSTCLRDSGGDGYCR